LRTLRALEGAEGKKGDPTLALAAIREARQNLILIGRLTGELKNPEPAEPTKVEIVYVDKMLAVERERAGTDRPSLAPAATDDQSPSLPPAA
jgi:hypothetical protein